MDVSGPSAMGVMPASIPDPHPGVPGAQGLQKDPAGRVEAVGKVPALPSGRSLGLLGHAGSAEQGPLAGPPEALGESRPHSSAEGLSAGAAALGTKPASSPPP